jgi:hypothetical protein
VIYDFYLKCVSDGLLTIGESVIVILLIYSYFHLYTILKMLDEIKTTSIGQYLIYQWDMFIYRISYKSHNRIIKRNPGLAYLFKLHIDEELKRNKISKHLKKNVEKFYTEEVIGKKG